MAVGILLVVVVVDAGVTGWLLAQYVHIRKINNLLVEDIRAMAKELDLRSHV